MLLCLVVYLVHCEGNFEEFHLEVLVGAPGRDDGYDELFRGHDLGVGFVGDLMNSA